MHLATLNSTVFERYRLYFDTWALLMRRRCKKGSDVFFESYFMTLHSETNTLAAEQSLLWMPTIIFGLNIAQKNKHFKSHS